MRYNDSKKKSNKYVASALAVGVMAVGGLTSADTSYAGTMPESSQRTKVNKALRKDIGGMLDRLHELKSINHNVRLSEVEYKVWNGKIEVKLMQSDNSTSNSGFSLSRNKVLRIKTYDMDRSHSTIFEDYADVKKREYKSLDYIAVDGSEVPKLEIKNYEKLFDDILTKLKPDLDKEIKKIEKEHKTARDNALNGLDSAF